MKQFQSQLKKQADKVKLTGAERRDLHARLSTYMEYHPLSTAQSTAAPDTAVQSEPFTVWSIRPFFIRHFAATLVLVMVIGVPIVAERSVPGDVLYPIKVQFNEEVRSSLARTSFDKVAWETERLERRIAEARLLAKEGKLTPEAEAKVAAAVKAHSDAAQEEIEQLRGTDADEAAIAEVTFSSALDVQSAVLKSDQAEASTTPMAVQIASTVEGERAESSLKQAEQPIVSLDRLKGRIEQETTRAYEYLETVKSYANEQELADIERRLADIERKIETAFTEDASATSSTKALKEALASTQKLIAFMTDIDVRETVTIEDLIPVELTSEELETEFAQSYEVLLKDIETLRAQTDTEDEAVQEKVAEALAKVERLVVQIEEARATEKQSAAETTYATARELVDDMLTLLSAAEAEPAPEVEEPVEESTDETELKTGQDTSTSSEAVEGIDEVNEQTASSSDATPEVPAGNASSTTAEPASSQPATSSGQVIDTP